MSEEIKFRIQRIYAAINASIEFDISKRKPKVYRGQDSILLCQDFRGDKKYEDAVNEVYNIIHALGCFRDNFKNYCFESHNIQREEVERFLRNSFEFGIIMDLWNRDKHRGDPHNQGWTGKFPSLENIDYQYRMKLNGSGTAKFFPLSGKQVGGEGMVIVTATVVDRNQQSVGDLNNFIEGALATCEAAFNRFLQKDP